MMPVSEITLEIRRCTEKSVTVFSFRKFVFSSPRIGSKNWSSPGSGILSDDCGRNDFHIIVEQGNIQPEIVV